MISHRPVLVAAILTAANGAAQVPLSVDTTFRVDLPAQNVFSLLPLPDGKLLISGILEFEELPEPPRSGERLLHDGQRDPTFNVGPMGGKITPWNDRYYSGNGPGVRRLFWNGDRILHSTWSAIRFPARCNQETTTSSLTAAC